jgi:hypothetical protein
MLYITNRIKNTILSLLSTGVVVCCLMSSCDSTKKPNGTTEEEAKTIDEKVRLTNNKEITQVLINSIAKEVFFKLKEPVKDKNEKITDDRKQAIVIYEALSNAGVNENYKAEDTVKANGWKRASELLLPLKQSLNAELDNEKKGDYLKLINKSISEWNKSDKDNDTHKYAIERQKEAVESVKKWMQDKNINTLFVSSDYQDSRLIDKIKVENEELVKKNNKLENKNLLLTVITALSILGMIIIYFFYFKPKLKEKANSDLSEIDNYFKKQDFLREAARKAHINIADDNSLTLDEMKNIIYQLKPQAKSHKALNHEKIIEMLEFIHKTTESDELLKAIKFDINERSSKSEATQDYEPEKREKVWDNLNDKKAQHEPQNNNVFYMRQPSIESDGRGYFEDSRSNYPGGFTCYRFSLKNERTATFTFDALPERTMNFINSRTNYITPVCDINNNSSPQTTGIRTDEPGRATLSSDGRWIVDKKATVSFV